MYMFYVALGGPKQVETYGSEPSKRHTMSYEPEMIPDMEHIDQRPSPIKKQKEKVKKKIFILHTYIIEYSNSL